jgi:hypothetical protein
VAEAQLQEQPPARSQTAGQKAAATRRANADKAPKQWAREYAVCVKCGRDDSRHQGKGICERCSRAERRDVKPAEQAPLRGPGKVTAAQQRNVKSMLVVAIAGADALAARVAPLYWTAEDRLQQDETALLVKAIYAELEAWPKALMWIASAAEHGVHVQLAYALVMVALPRLMRRNLVPADVATLLFLAASQPQPPVQPGPDAVPVAAGPAPEPDRHDGNGQVHSGFVPGRDATVHSGFQEQA